MNNYDEEKVLKIASICSGFILLFVIMITSEFNIKNVLASITHKSPKENKTEIVSDISPGYSNTTTEIGDISDKLVIPLPSGVTAEDVDFNYNVINKKITIAFPKGAQNFDVSSVINNSQYVSNIVYGNNNNIIEVDASLNKIMAVSMQVENDTIYIAIDDPDDKYSSVIVIDAGHGGNDVGAVRDNFYEKDIDLDIVLKLKNYLDEENICVFYTRLDDSYPTVEQRVDFVNELMPDLFISVHSNWYEDSLTNGTSVLYNNKDKSEHGSEWLAQIMQNEVHNAAGTFDKGIVVGNDIHIVRTSKVPVALVEAAFMSNDNDFKILYTTIGQEKFALGLYNGIIKALTGLGKYE